MKIRYGFVSNSSSSSFLVAFPRNPKSVEDVQEMVFGDETFFAHPYANYSHYPSGYPVEKIAEIIWNDVQKQIPNNKNLILSRMHSVLVDDIDEYYEDDEHWELDVEQWRGANEKANLEFMAEHAGSFFYCLIYADDEGPLDCAMEHGNLFKRLPHLRSSNH